MPQNGRGIERTFTRCVGVLVMFFIVIAGVSFIQEARGASLLYQKKRDDRSSAYIQLQNTLKKINGHEEGKTEALEFFTILEVLGAPGDISTKIALARLASDADTKLSADRKLIDQRLLDDPIQYVEGREEASSIEKWFAASALARNCVTLKELKRLNEKYPRVAAHWSRFIAHVDTAQLHANWPVIGMDRCANAHGAPSARLRALATRHALRLRAIMRPPKEEVLIKIGSNLIHARMPIDPGEWTTVSRGVGVEDLLVLERQMNMGMPPMPLSALNLYKNTCAWGYDFQTKPALMIEVVPSSVLQGPSLQSSITSDRIFGSANFAVQHHVHEIIRHGCSKVFVSSTGREELHSLCALVIEELSMKIGAALGHADADSSVYKHNSDWPAKERGDLTDRPYGECGFVSVLGGDVRLSCWRGFARFDFDEEINEAYPGYHRVVVTAGELLAFATAKSSTRCYACVSNHTCDKGREAFWYSARPSTAWSLRGYSLQNILVNCLHGRPYSMEP